MGIHTCGNRTRLRVCHVILGSDQDWVGFGCHVDGSAGPGTALPKGRGPCLIARITRALHLTVATPVRWCIHL